MILHVLTVLFLVRPRTSLVSHAMLFLTGAMVLTTQARFIGTLTVILTLLLTTCIIMLIIVFFWLALVFRVELLTFTPAIMLLHLTLATFLSLYVFLSAVTMMRRLRLGSLLLTDVRVLRATAPGLFPGTP